MVSGSRNRLGPGLTRGWRLAVAGGLLMAGLGMAQAQDTAAIARPLRYRAEGQDFVITNGPGRFNRALYGSDPDFRVLAGEVPELALALPERGGQLRLGVSTTSGSKWLAGAERVTARYRAGSMVYEVRDRLLGNAVLTVIVLPLTDANGVIVRAELSEGAPVDLVWSFGGASGATVPLTPGAPGEGWAFAPADFSGGSFALEGAGFRYAAPAGAFDGTGPVNGTLEVRDASRSDSLPTLLASPASADTPVLVGRAPVSPGAPAHVVIQQSGQAGTRNAAFLALNNLYRAAESARQAIVNQAAVSTPDDYTNAAVAALVVAADALWQQSSMVDSAGGERTPLPGWRGPLALDVFGWFDRSAQHLRYWAGQQLTEATAVAGDSPLLSSGALPIADRDMNLSFAEALMRHLRWTNDRELARSLWPFLRRHFDWEKRLFDREGLYEGYRQFAAAEGLAYGGGGSAAASAANYFQRRLAVQVATLIGEDPQADRTEQIWIADAIEHELWQPELGWYAEYKDTVGEGRVHGTPALWSVTRMIDSEFPTAEQAQQALAFATTTLARIPVVGDGVPEGDWYTLPTSNWLGGEGRLNNVLPGEAAQAALALWQSGRADEAWKLWKGTVIDAMFRGAIPGNVPAASPLDPWRGSNPGRDDGDTIGALARSVIEGLFGIRPDAMAGQLQIRPGYPIEWEQASIKTPYLDFSFRREGQTDRYTITTSFGQPLRPTLSVRPRGDRVLSVEVNGATVNWTGLSDAVGDPRIQVPLEPGVRQDIVIRWVGRAPAPPAASSVVLLGRGVQVSFAPARVVAVSDPQGVLRNVEPTDTAVGGTVSGQPGHRLLFVQLTQGDLTWWQPVALEVRSGLELVPLANQDAGRIRFRIRNHTNLTWNRMTVVTIGSQRSTLVVQVPAQGDSTEIALATPSVLPGSSEVRVDLGELGVAEARLTNWQQRAGAQTDWRTVDLGSSFNDSVENLFRQASADPGLPAASLRAPFLTSPTAAGESLPDSSGLRQAAGASGQIQLPQGIPFLIPTAAGAPNVVLTSRWSNHPDEVNISVNGRASRAYLLLVAATNPMQSRTDNAEIVVTYRDGSSQRLALVNPDNLWPVDQDFYTDDWAFRLPAAAPLRVELGTGRVYVPSGFARPVGGAASVIDLPLDPTKTLWSVSLRTLANDVVVGLMGLTLVR